MQMRYRYLLICACFSALLIAQHWYFFTENARLSAEYRANNAALAAELQMHISSAAIKPLHAAAPLAVRNVPKTGPCLTPTPSLHANAPGLRAEAALNRDCPRYVCVPASRLGGLGHRLSNLMQTFLLAQDLGVPFLAPDLDIEGGLHGAYEGANDLFGAPASLPLCPHNASVKPLGDWRVQSIGLASNLNTDTWRAHPEPGFAAELLPQMSECGATSSGSLLPAPAGLWRRRSGWTTSLAMAPVLPA